jgi:hypothetical protein
LDAGSSLWLEIGAQRRHCILSAGNGQPEISIRSFANLRAGEQAVKLVRVPKCRGAAVLPFSFNKVPARAGH